MVHIDIGPFFYVEDRFLTDFIAKESASDYGDFLIHPRSHFEVWDKKYYSVYNVDFYYYPRGRVTYHKSNNTYIVYCDKCITDIVKSAFGKFEGCNNIF